MPKIPRTPQGQAPETERQPAPDPGAAKPGGVEPILAGMETRLVRKMEETKRSVLEVLTMSQMNSQAIDALEERVDDNRDEVAKALREMEEKLTNKIREQVKDLVGEGLKSVGFDTQLSTGDLSTVVCSQPGSTSYAAALACPAPDRPTRTKEDRKKESKFWKARSSLLL